MDGSPSRGKSIFRGMAARNSAPSCVAFRMHNMPVSPASLSNVIKAESQKGRSYY